jgi:hypothetical protein
MRITRVALSFFSVGVLAGTFERAAGLGDTQVDHRVSAFLLEGPAASPGAPIATGSIRLPEDRGHIVLAAVEPVSGAVPVPVPVRARRPAPQSSDGHTGDAQAAELIAAIAARPSEPDMQGRPMSLLDYAGLSPVPEASGRMLPLLPEPQLLAPPRLVRERAAVAAREFITPIDRGRVTSMFHQGRYHPAIDLAAPLGTPVRATTRKQKVTFAGRRGGYGNLIVTRDPAGREHYYGHLHRIIAGLGALLEQGDLLGLLGSTGHSTGPHVHYEVRTRGRHLDPSGLLFPDFRVGRGYAWNEQGSTRLVAAQQADTARAAPTRVRAVEARRTRVRAARVKRARARLAGRYRGRMTARYVTPRTYRYTSRVAARYSYPRPR